MKNKATMLFRRIMSVFTSMAKAKTLAVKSKTSALRTRLVIFSLLRNKKILMTSISNKLHALRGQQDHNKDQEDAEADMGGDQSKALVLYNLSNPTHTQFLQNEEDDNDKYPDLTHSLFESEDLEFEDQGVSVIDMVKNSKKEGEEFRLEDEIDHVADLFIRRFYRQMRLQKQLSVKRQLEMLQKSSV